MTTSTDGVAAEPVTPPAVGKQSGHPHSAWQSGALQAIFAVFLGVIVALVVGVGVNTFHPNPANDTRDQIDQLYRDQESQLAAKARPDAVLTQEEQQLQSQILELEETARQQEQDWASSTSVAIIAIATLLLAGAVVLARVAAAWVFSTGLLLGGIFTMLYGVILSMSSGESVLRFLLLLVALGVTSLLGYLRFVRTPAGPTTVGPAVVEGGAATDLERRVAALESSIASLRRALVDWRG